MCSEYWCWLAGGALFTVGIPVLDPKTTPTGEASAARAVGKMDEEGLHLQTGDAAAADSRGRLSATRNCAAFMVRGSECGSQRIMPDEIPLPPPRLARNSPTFM
jgi:hypothetical protein